MLDAFEGKNGILNIKSEEITGNSLLNEKEQLDLQDCDLELA